MNYWTTIYDSIEETHRKIKNTSGVISVFNSNIDAVAHVSPERFLSWIKTKNAQDVTFSTAPQNIDSWNSFFEGFLYCFAHGVAMERLIISESLFTEIHDIIGYDRLQMGGQGGIIGNVMAVAGVQNVYVHAASLSPKQTELFIDLPNLITANKEGLPIKAHNAERIDELPLIHWILEFSKGDTLKIGDKTITCPKSNRFIATWDPQNFMLYIDPTFNSMISNIETPVHYCLLSGYQMLTEPLSNGDSAQNRIDQSLSIVQKWKEKHSDMCIHFEFASTQDPIVRKQLFESMNPIVDSLGCNEQELIDLLEVIGETDLANQCKTLDPKALVKGLIALYKKSKAPRIQLHFFGMFITIRQKGAEISAKTVQKGMAYAATAAASKALIGNIDTEESLFAAKSLAISDISKQVLESVAEYIDSTYRTNQFLENGIVQSEEFELIALPTILVDDPVTLVGMGDTISSLSLVGAQ